MGWKNVDRAALVDIRPAAAQLLLIHMARVAHDDTGHYYGGIPWLVLRMHYPMNANGERAVYRLISQLVAAGYVKPNGLERGRRVYVLTLPEPVPGNGAHPHP